MERELLRTALEALGHEVISTADGAEAWLGYLRNRDTRVVITDWLMPKVDGLALCRRVRGASEVGAYVYLVVLTVKSGRLDFLEAMKAGADDFIRKPFDREELQARLEVAKRMVGVQRELRQLENLLSICAYCKSVRDDDDEWVAVEKYLEARVPAEFTHSICPRCYESEVAPQLKEIRREGECG